MESKELLKKHESEFWLCSRCSLCKFPPLAQIKSSRFYSVCCSMDYGNFHPWSGGGKVIMGASLFYDRIEKFSDEMRDAVLQCTLCGACDVSCKYSTDMEVQDTIFNVRRYIIKEMGPHPSHKKFAEAAEKVNNPYNDPHEKRQDWINTTNAKSNSDSKTLFFTGCTSAYRQKDMVKASVEILNATEYDFQISKDEYCCGSPIYRAGMVEKAKKFFEYNLELFNKLGIEEVITACPGCYAMFVAEYPKHLDQEHFKLWESIKFRHMTEVVDVLFKKKKIELIDNPGDKILATYHDPCHLGRGGEPYVPEWKGTKKKVYNQITVYDPPKVYRRGAKGVYEPPRNILKKLKDHVQFVEMFRIEEYAYCCGSGGGVKAAYPEMAMNSVKERLEEVEYVLNEASNDENTEKMLISACPFCKTNFEDGLTETGKSIKYIDINQLVWERMKK